MPLLLRFVCELNINAMSDATCPSLTERNTTCPKCQHSLTKTDLKELRGLGKLIHIVESGSLVRCPSCGHLFPIINPTCLGCFFKLFSLSSKALKFHAVGEIIRVCIDVFKEEFPKLGLDFETRASIHNDHIELARFAFSCRHEV